jgi:hypothetical protein
VRCGKLLGIVGKDRVHIRFARGHEYMVGFPVTGICRGCQTLNEKPQADGDAPACAGSKIGV